MRTNSCKSIALLIVLISLLAPGSSAQAGKMRVTFTSTFDDLVNDGGWSFGNRNFETIEPEGGNPDGYLRNSFLEAFAAQPRTEAGFPRTIFHGDYRDRNVTSLGIDLAVFDADFSTQGRPLTVILVDDGGTRDDESDDCRVYRIGGRPTPMPKGSWKRYRFRIPSQSPTLPKGWNVQDCTGMTNDEAWNRVITGVDQLRFFTGDPELFYIFQMWDIGLDNATLTQESPPPDF